MITHTVPLRQRPIFGGVLAGMENVAATGAPLLGGVITGKCGYKAPASLGHLTDASLLQTSYLGGGASI